MIEKRFGEKKFSYGGMYIRSIADIPKLYAIGLRRAKDLKMKV